MKLLFDLLPVILFFVTFKVAGAYPQQSLAIAGSTLGWMVGDGTVPADQAPILLATAVAIIASIVQVGSVLARGRRVDPMLWVSLGVIVVFGGATIWFHDETFIKWKPSILYWLFGASLLAGHLVWKKNLLHTLLGTQLEVPTPVWERAAVGVDRVLRHDGHRQPRRGLLGADRHLGQLQALRPVRTDAGVHARYRDLSRRAT